jgi:delta 1-pyrroline-5-carboxylate dehydrogenase
MSAQAARRVDPSTIVSTNPGRNYEVVGEVRVSSAAEIAVAVRQASAAQSTWQGCGVGRLSRLWASGVLIRGAPPGKCRNCRA